jgi:uncharacterized protein YggE
MEHSTFSGNISMIKTVLLAALPALFLMPAAPRAQAADAAPQKPVIRVTGQGSVQSKPDAATINAGVTSENADPKAALAQNTAATAKVIDELKAAGIAAEDLKTVNFSIYSQIRTDNEKRQTLTYRVSNTVTVKVRDLAKLGDVLAKVVAAGSNQVSGPNFMISSPDKPLAEARKLAVKDAQEKAQTFAAAAGMTLGAVVEITDDVSVATPVFRQAGYAARSADAVPVESGEESVRASVSMTFEMSKG